MRFKIRGHLTVTRLPVNRRFTDEVVFEDDNMVVNLGVQVFSRMLGGNVGAPTIGGATFSNIDDLVVTTMKLGNNPAPSVPTASDTDGVTPGFIIYSPPLAVTYPTDYAVRFTGIIPNTEANGETISEEAVYLKNGLVFAKRIISPGVAKDSSFALKFDHTFEFERV